MINNNLGTTVSNPNENSDKETKNEKIAQSNVFDLGEKLGTRVLNQGLNSYQPEQVQAEENKSITQSDASEESEKEETVIQDEVSNGLGKTEAEKDYEYQFSNVTSAVGTTSKKNKFKENCKAGLDALNQHADKNAELAKEAVRQCVEATCRAYGAASEYAKDGLNYAANATKKAAYKTCDTISECASKSLNCASNVAMKVFEFIKKVLHNLIEITLSFIKNIVKYFLVMPVVDIATGIINLCNLMIEMLKKFMEFISEMVSKCLELGRIAKNKFVEIAGPFFSKNQTAILLGTCLSGITALAGYLAVSREFIKF